MSAVWAQCLGVRHGLSVVIHTRQTALMPCRRLCFSLVLSVCWLPLADAEPRAVVVELFTAQGCSSCPPADAYVGELSARPGVIALAFHVDYWDDLGWRDRFALTQSVTRQKGYARTLRLPSLYTPQLVLDGRSDAVATDNAAVSKALGEQPEGVSVRIALRDNQIVVDVGGYTQLPKSDVLLVPYLRHAVSAVGRGENAGRKLEEFNIVRGVLRLGSWAGTPHSYYVMGSQLPEDATDVAVLIQTAGQGPIVGSAARALR